MSALVAFNVFNYESIRGVLEAAREANSKVYLQASQSAIRSFGAMPFKRLIDAVLQDFPSDIAILHLDHCTDTDVIRRCLDAGWDSVMFDGSSLPLRANIESSGRVVELAHSYGARVETEIGAVGGEEDGHEALREGKAHFTDVIAFAGAVKTDLLAVGIGNKHGHYADDDPELDLDLLASVHQALPGLPLVLHGASGLSEDVVAATLKLGIAKVNVSTDLKDTYYRALAAYRDGRSAMNMIGMVESVVGAIRETASVHVRRISGNGAAA